MWARSLFLYALKLGPRMFLADMLVILAVYVVAAVFALLGMIPYAGVVFQIIGGVVSFAISLVMPLLLGLINAAGYEEFFVKEGKGDIAA